MREFDTEGAMEAYLDNSATTPCLESVRDIVVMTMMVDYGNPSTRHQKGVEAEHYLKDAREKIAATLKVKEKEIFFTSGGTESNNWALTGTAFANRRAGCHIITTAVEHAAVRMPLRFLEDQGFDGSSSGRHRKCGSPAGGGSREGGHDSGICDAGEQRGGNS